MTPPNARAPRKTDTGVLDWVQGGQRLQGEWARLSYEVVRRERQRRDSLRQPELEWLRWLPPRRIWALADPQSSSSEPADNALVGAGAQFPPTQEGALRGGLVSTPTAALPSVATSSAGDSASPRSSLDPEAILDLAIRRGNLLAAIATHAFEQLPPLAQCAVSQQFLQSALAVTGTAGFVGDLAEGGQSDHARVIAESSRPLRRARADLLEFARALAYHLRYVLRCLVTRPVHAMHQGLALATFCQHLRATLP